MAETEPEIAAALIERLLVDPAFRARFRHDPAQACHEAGLHEVAEEMRLGAGKAMMTLDVRESRSSLAGVLMAAAMEGVGVYGFAKHVLPGLEDLPGAVGDVLSRVDLPALPGRGALAGGAPEPVAAVPEPEVEEEDVAPAAAAGAAGPVAALPDAPVDLPPAPKEPDGGGGGGNGAGKGGGGGGAAGGGGAPAPAPAPEPAPAPAPAPAPDPAPAPEPAAVPAGGVEASAQAVLDNPNITLPPGARADLEGGIVDPRLVAVMQGLSQQHKIGLSVIKTGHSQFTSGGSVSNHFVGRGIDIATVDGQPVSPGNAGARDLVAAIAGLDAKLRPTEVGSPWQIGAPGFFTDGAHQDHVHVAFDGDAPDGAEVPVIAPPAPPAGAPAPAAGGVAVAPEPPRREGSGLFAAVAAQDEPAAKPAEKGGSGLFAAITAKEEQPAPAPAGAPAPPLEVAGTVGQYPGDNAGQPAIAAWMAAEAKARGIPPELPVMAGLVESGLRNLNFGDADSIGFFQMRVSIWNQGEYAGYGDDPQKQIDWFLDQAEAVKAQRISRGLSVDDPNQFGEWIADVERPAEQFRGRYQLRLDEAQGLLRSAPAPSGDAAAAAPAAVPDAAAAAPVAPAAPIDPGQFGAEGTGTGGPPDAAAQALLENKRVILDSVGVADIKAGRIDPRIVAVLTTLSKEHTITVSCMCSDHSKFTVGGSVSNHHFGRGLDIAAIDGRPVNASNFEAREMALELQELAPSIRPDEIGSPFSIAGPGYFTDSGHQDHLHVGFKQLITPDFKLPPDLAAPAPADPGVAVAEAPRREGSGLFAAIAQPRAARAAVAADAGKADAGGSGLFKAIAARGPGGAAAAAGAPVAGSPAGAFPVTPSPAGGQAADVLAPPNLTSGPGPQARAALAEARKYMGTPYQWGGSTPETGFDCSGLVQWAYAQAGVKIPRVTDQQIAAGNGNPVRRGELLPGDLVFFRDPSGYVHHVGMSLGGDRFIHAPHTGDVVKESSLKETYYRQQFAGGRRFGAAAPAAPAVPQAAAVLPAVDAAAAQPAGAEPAIDPAAVADARAAAARDAELAREPGSGLFRAITAQEARNHRAAAAAAKGDERGSGLFAALSPEVAKERQAGQAARAADAASAAAAPRTPVPAAPGAPPDLSAVPADYPGNDASQQELAKWLAREAQKAGLPAELPVMAALVESGVRNLSFGHADSVGFFQMRVSIWNRGAYAGYPQNPGLQIKWFIDQAVALKNKRIAQGYENFGSDPATWGTWIADVERPAEQFRGRYQLRLAEARRLLR